MSWLTLSLLVLALLAQSMALVPMPSEVEVYVSSNSGMRLAKSDRDLTWNKKDEEKEASTRTLFTIDETTVYQTIRGFGASILEAGTMNFNLLSPKRQKELMTLLFKQASLSALKLPMLCNDFCAAGPWSTYDDTPGDFTLNNFSIQRDLAPNGTLSFFKRAVQEGFAGITQSYMDYPPDWMLSKPLPKNATIDPKFYPILAEYFAKFIESYAQQGVHIDYLALFNEPMDSYTNITEEEMGILVGDYVGPRLAKLAPEIAPSLTYGGQATRAWALRSIPKVMAVGNASKYINHIAFHGYDCQYNCSKERQFYSSLEEIHELYPDLEILMTEICYAYNDEDATCNWPICNTHSCDKCTDWPRNHSLAPALPIFQFDDGRVWGSRIISDLESGTSAWIYWNLILNMQGGPFQLSPEHNDAGQNLQQALVHVNPATDSFQLTGAFWYLAHFSRFVTPHLMKRMKTTLKSSEKGVRPIPGSAEGTNGVESIGFVEIERNEHNERKICLQLLNHNDRVEKIEVAYHEWVSTVSLPPISISTLVFTI